MPQTPSKKPDPTAPTQYRYIGYHAQILNSGQPLAPGDYVTLGPDDFTGDNNINQMLLDDGKIIDATGVSAQSMAAQAEEGGEA